MERHCAILVSCLTLLVMVSMAQPLAKKTNFTHADTLRGSLTPERTWWDVQRYDITVTPDYHSKSITGFSKIIYKPVMKTHTNYMQIDLQKPMLLDSVVFDNELKILAPNKSIIEEGNAYHVMTPAYSDLSTHSLTVYFHGSPPAAKNPPWDGGWIWKQDAQGRPWMSVAVQGLGASAWYPCKDHQSDEPDLGASLTINVPDTLVAVANGRLVHKNAEGSMASYTWEVKSPINNYNIVPYIGKYVNFGDTLHGEKGILDLNYWVLDYDLEKAMVQFKQVKPMLRAFEYWFGAYPFYEDGYKLVQAPHLGMEHQSAVAYGNQFKNGYLGRDLSGTGQGLHWDYIIVHESGHEWFGNNITTKDIADMWVHEGFTDYAETLFIEYYFGKEAANQYVQGLRKNITNDKPIIGTYGVNAEGSTDMYYKGANLLHTIRQILHDDKKFRQICRGLNKDFYHQTVTSKQVEEYISFKSGIDFSKVFDQYLRTTQIPLLELREKKGILRYRWKNCIAGFQMPVQLNNGSWLYPTTSEKKLKIAEKDFHTLTTNPNFYIQVKRTD